MKSVTPNSDLRITRKNSLPSWRSCIRGFGAIIIMSCLFLWPYSYYHVPMLEFNMRGTSWGNIIILDTGRLLWCHRRPEIIYDHTFSWSNPARPSGDAWEVFMQPPNYGLFYWGFNAFHEWMVGVPLWIIILASAGITLLTWNWRGRVRAQGFPTSP